MGRASVGIKAGVTLDAGALIALDRGDKRMIALLDRALRHTGFHPLYSTDVWGIHVLIFARRA